MIDKISATALAIGTNLFWEQVGHPATPAGMYGATTKFTPSGGKVTVAVTYKEVSVVGTCSGTASKVFSFVDAGSALRITDLSQYTMTIAMDQSNLVVPVTLTCVPPVGPTYSKTVMASYPVHLVTPGPLFAQDTIMTGSVGPTAEGFGITRTGSWMLLSNPNGF